jgi:hypothetical protein
VDVIKLAATVATVLGAVVVAWLRYRRVRLKVSPEGIEMEGSSMKQLREGLQLADEYQRNQPRIIR